MGLSTNDSAWNDSILGLLFFFLFNNSIPDKLPNIVSKNCVSGKMVQYNPLLAWGCGLNNISSRAAQQPLLFWGTKSSYPLPVLVYKRGGCAVFQTLSSVTPNEMLSDWEARAWLSSIDGWKDSNLLWGNFWALLRNVLDQLLHWQCLHFFLAVILMVSASIF